jgi:hypothetical protein
MKFVALSLIASASAFAPSAQLSRTSALNQHIGSGGMADTRNPEASVNEDPRKSISAAPSFEEYLKQRAAQDGAPAAAAGELLGSFHADMILYNWLVWKSISHVNFDCSFVAVLLQRHSFLAPAAAAPVAAGKLSCVCSVGWRRRLVDVAMLSSISLILSTSLNRQRTHYYTAPVAAAPAAATGTGGDVLSTLQSLQGPGEVWGADGIAVGKEESDLRGYDNFGKFFDLIQSTGVAAELQGAGPFTIFAPTVSSAMAAKRTPVRLSHCSTHPHRSVLQYPPHTTGPRHRLLRDHAWTRRCSRRQDAHRSRTHLLC